MKIYAAVGGGRYGGWLDAYASEIATSKEDPPPQLRLLSSFAYTAEPMYQRMQPWVPNVDLMVDSGAFSVWVSSRSMRDLEAYIEWLHVKRVEFGEQIVIINLDVIPGAPGVRPTERERKRAIKQSMENADKIRAAGLPVMEVFHLHDGSFKVMEDLWARRQPGEIFGIGGLAGMGTSRSEMVQFGDDVFRRVKDWCGGWEGITRLHGLGINPNSAMSRRYPWWSIDSSAPTMIDRFGKAINRSGGVVEELTPNVRGRGKSTTKPVSDLYFLRLAKHWRRQEESYSSLWSDRGVSFADERVAA